MIQSRTLGEDHPSTASTYSALGANLAWRGNYAEAELLFQKALEIRLKVLGGVHADTAESYNLLALDMGYQGKYAEAEPLHRKALEISRRIPDQDFVMIASYSNNLSNNLAAQGKHAESLSLLEEAQKIRYRVLGENDPQTAVGDDLLARYLAGRGSWPRPRAPSQVAGGPEAHPGENHPFTAACYLNLALNLHAQGRFGEAETAAIEAARSYEAARSQVSYAGLEQADFASNRSPLALVAAMMARQGRDREAWQRSGGWPRAWPQGRHGSPTAPDPHARRAAPAG